MNGTNKLKGFVFGLVCILLIAIVIYSGFRFLETTVFLEEETEPVVSEHVTKTIERDGVKYKITFIGTKHGRYCGSNP